MSANPQKLTSDLTATQENIAHYHAVTAVESLITEDAPTDQLKEIYRDLDKSFRERKAEDKLALGEVRLMGVVRRILTQRGESVSV
jgi:hypothetical protein